MLETQPQLPLGLSEPKRKPAQVGSTESSAEDQERIARRREYHRKYLREHKEQKRAYDKKRRLLHGDEIRAKQAAYVRKWRHRLKATQKERYQKIKEVVKLKQRERYRKNPQRYIAETKAYAQNNREKVKGWTTRRTFRRKLKVLHKYGGVCACCGESEVLFLTVDHVNENGAEHRKSVSPDQLYRWLMKNPPSPDFQVLCMNCNWGRSKNNGICPHKKPKGTVHANLGICNHV